MNLHFICKVMVMKTITAATVHVERYMYKSIILLGSRNGSLVIALAPTNVDWVQARHHKWVDSRFALRGFLRVLWFSSLHKNQISKIQRTCLKTSWGWWTSSLHVNIVNLFLSLFIYQKYNTRLMLSSYHMGNLWGEFLDHLTVETHTIQLNFSY